MPYPCPPCNITAGLTPFVDHISLPAGYEIQWVTPGFWTDSPEAGRSGVELPTLPLLA
jgi:hypothetical protein